MPIYHNADEVVTERITRLIEDHHPHLLEAGVDVRALMAFPKPKEFAAVKLHGYKAAAIVKKVALKERVQGLGDALIIIDAVLWDRLTEKQRNALIDHELMHLQVKTDSSGKVLRDEAGRPKLEMQLHDWQLGGFAEISARYGDDALEIEAVRIASDKYGQLFWNFERNPIGSVTLGHVEDDEAKPKRKGRRRAS